MMKPFAALLAAAAVSVPLMVAPLSNASAETWRQITIDRRGPPGPPPGPHVRERHQHRQYVMPRHRPPHPYWAEQDVRRAPPGYDRYYYR